MSPPPPPKKKDTAINLFYFGVGLLNKYLTSSTLVQTTLNLTLQIEIIYLTGSSTFIEIFFKTFLSSYFQNARPGALIRCQWANDNKVEETLILQLPLQGNVIS